MSKPYDPADGWKLYGPYHRPDGRQHVVVVRNAADGSIAEKRTVSYPKYLTEMKLGRYLNKGETVDHHDRDFVNDDLTNYRVIDRPIHAALDVLRVKTKEVNCVQCGTTFLPTRNQRGPRANTKAGPFCSRKCKGTYGQSVQVGGEVIVRVPVEVEYYRLNKNLKNIAVEKIKEKHATVFETVTDVANYTSIPNHAIRRRLKRYGTFTIGNYRITLLKTMKIGF